MNGKWIEVFSTGTHTDSKGNTQKWTKARLDRIVKAYNPKVRETPHVVGHPKTDSPAFGWVAAYKREGEKLLALCKDMHNGFVRLVNSGAYKKRSISINPKTYQVNHIGWLGGVQPAVASMKDVKFGGSKKAVTYDMAVSTPKEGKKMKVKKLKERHEAEMAAANKKIANLKKKPKGKQSFVSPKRAKSVKKSVDKLLKKHKITPGNYNMVHAYAIALAAYGKVKVGEKKVQLSSHFLKGLQKGDKDPVFRQFSIDVDATDYQATGKGADVAASDAIARAGGAKIEKEK